MSTVGVIVNAAAGSRDGEAIGRRVHELLKAAGHAVEDFSAPTLAQATDRARAAATAGLSGLVVVGGDGAVARPLRANRVRVQAGDRVHEVVNPGSGYAVTLHLYV